MCILLGSFTQSHPWPNHFTIRYQVLILVVPEVMVGQGVQHPEEQEGNKARLGFRRQSCAPAPGSTVCWGESMKPWHKGSRKKCSRVLKVTQPS